MSLKPSHDKKIQFTTKTPTLGRRPNDFLGLSLNDKTILFLVILLDKTVSVDKTVFALGSSPIVDILKFIDVQRVLKQKDGHDISEADGAAIRAPL